MRIRVHKEKTKDELIADLALLKLIYEGDRQSLDKMSEVVGRMKYSNLPFVRESALGHIELVDETIDICEEKLAGVEVMMQYLTGEGDNLEKPELQDIQSRIGLFQGITQSFELFFTTMQKSFEDLGHE